MGDKWKPSREQCFAALDAYQPEWRDGHAADDGRWLNGMRRALEAGAGPLMVGLEAEAWHHADACDEQRRRADALDLEIGALRDRLRVVEGERDRWRAAEQQAAADLACEREARALAEAQLDAKVSR